MPQVRLKPATPQSQVKHSITKHLRARLILMVYILIEMNSNAKKQCFVYFSSVSNEISVNLIKRCHYSRYTILTNRSTRVLPSTTIRRIPQLFCFNRFQLKIIKPRPEIRHGMVQIAYRNRELTSYPKINHEFVISKAVFTAGALSSQYQAALT